MQDIFSSNGKDVKLVTIGIAVICNDGIVIGADRKVIMERGTRIKSLENKIFTLSFRDQKKLLLCVAGTFDHAKRAMAEINPWNIDTLDCGSYRDMIESNISHLRWKLSQRGLTYDATLLFGMIDRGTPVIGHIMPSALVELKYDGYFTAGIAASYAEMVLKDSYSKNTTIMDTKLMIGGLIEKISKVDDDVEGMDVFSMSTVDERIDDGLTWEERNAITSEDMFSFDLKQNLPTVKANIKYWTDLLEKAESKKQIEVEVKEQIEDKSTHNDS
jgi:20S proteasome alpha/beta subunit